jgi:hypothetical protein
MSPRCEEANMSPEYVSKEIQKYRYLYDAIPPGLIIGIRFCFADVSVG